MSAKVSDQIAHLRSNLGIIMLYQDVEIVIYVCVVNVLIKIFADSCQLRD